MSEVGHGDVLGVELGVEGHVVLSDLSEILIVDLVLGTGLGKVVSEGVVGVLKVGNGVGLSVEVDRCVVELDPRSIKLSVQIADGRVQTVGLVNKSDVGLFELTALSLEG